MKFFLSSFFIVFFSFTGTAYGKTNFLSRQIVAQLYKDFAWQAILSENNDFILLQDENKNVLEKYFSSELTELIIKDARCRGKSGEICSLDFDLLFDSQDSAAYDLKINASKEGTVEVNFIYPPNNKKINLLFYLQETSRGWRIVDIIYKDKNEVSLKQLLIQNK